MPHKCSDFGDGLLVHVIGVERGIYGDQAGLCRLRPLAACPQVREFGAIAKKLDVRPKQPRKPYRVISNASRIQHCSNIQFVLLPRRGEFWLGLFKRLCLGPQLFRGLGDG
jgi:hypothetical protein